MRDYPPVRCILGEISSSLWSTNLLPRRTSLPPQQQGESFSQWTPQPRFYWRFSAWMNLQLTSAKLPEWLLSGVCARLPAPLHPCVNKNTKCVIAFNADLFAVVRGVDLKRKKPPTRPDERRMIDFCSLVRVAAAAVQSKHWAASHTVQFVFAALRLNNQEPIRGGGCHREGAGSDCFVSPTLPYVCVSGSMNQAWSLACLCLFVCLFKSKQSRFIGMDFTAKDG